MPHALVIFVITEWYIIIDKNKIIYIIKKVLLKTFEKPFANN